MKTLLILRHAKSSWKDLDLADHDRPLSTRGKRDAPRMGHLLLEKELLPQLIISSTAKRARKTVKLVSEACGYKGDRLFIEALYAAGPEAYIGALRELGGGYERVMVVGHNPGLEELLDRLTGAGHTLPTAALAEVSLPIGSWDELGVSTEGELIGLWAPRELSED